LRRRNVVLLPWLSKHATIVRKTQRVSGDKVGNNVLASCSLYDFVHEIRNFELLFHVIFVVDARDLAGQTVQT
jgi:hypothetical protein